MELSLVAVELDEGVEVCGDHSPVAKVVLTDDLGGETTKPVWQESPQHAFHYTP